MVAPLNQGTKMTTKQPSSGGGVCNCFNLSCVCGCKCSEGITMAVTEGSSAVSGANFNKNVNTPSSNKSGGGSSAPSDTTWGGL